MHRVLRIGFTTAFVLVVLAWFNPAEGQDAKKTDTVSNTQKSSAVRVKIDLHSGEKLVGTMDLPGIVLETDSGSQTFKPDYVNRIAFSEEGTQDGVETTRKDVYRGHLQQTAWPVTVDGQARTLERDSLREIKIERPKDTSLLGIVLGLITLAAMEIILGVDNIIFLSIIAARLPIEQQPKARKIGLAAALGTRLLLLFSLSFILGLTAPVFTIPEMPYLQDLEAREVSWRDIILLAGGVYLIGNSVKEMHDKIEDSKHVEGPEDGKPKVAVSFAKTIATIAVVDIVFSLDSVITAVGMVDELWVMAVAMIIAMIVMMIFSESVARFVEKHPTIKVLALSFLILIGVMLVVEGLGQHIDKGYIYFAMAFAVAVEMVNLRLRRPHAKPAA